MNRRAIVALMLCLAGASLCAAGVPTDQFTIGMSGRNLFVSEGELFLLDRYGFTAIADKKNTSDRWYISATQIKSSVKGGGYLAYDPTGETNLVGLKPSPGKGTEWSIDVPGKGKTSEGEKAVIRAAKGPKKGWYLTVAEGRLILARDPSQKLQAQRWWKHK